MRSVPLLFSSVTLIAACSSTVTGTGETGAAPVDPAGNGPAPFGLPGKRAFVTSGTYAANFGADFGHALDAADADCYGTAKLAGLEGRWVAYLDDGETGLVRRIQNVGPWYARRVDAHGAETWHEVFANTANFHEPVPNATLDTDEHGRTVSGGAWTGVREDGSSDSNITCGGWSTTKPSSPLLQGEVGYIGFENKEWRAGFAAPCASLQHLYCFEQ